MATIFFKKFYERPKLSTRNLKFGTRPATWTAWCPPWMLLAPRWWETSNGNISYSVDICCMIRLSRVIKGTPSSLPDDEMVWWTSGVIKPFEFMIIGIVYISLNMYATWIDCQAIEGPRISTWCLANDDPATSIDQHDPLSSSYV